MNSGSKRNKVFVVKALLLVNGSHYKECVCFIFRACSVGSQKSYINQFPFEMVVTIKNMLATVARRVVKKHINHDTLEVKPDWLPVTFNLSSELPQFVSFFQQRERKYVNS